jgi:hypothetical protein
MFVVYEMDMRANLISIKRVAYFLFGPTYTSTYKQYLQNLYRYPQIPILQTIDYPNNDTWNIFHRDILLQVKANVSQSVTKVYEVKPNKPDT